MKFMLLLATLALAGAPAFAVDSYPLKCRGGNPGTLGFQLFSGGQTQINAQFKGANHAADRPLEPGECAWLDRGFRPGEPTMLCQSGLRDVFLSTVSIPVAGMASPQLIVQSQWSKSAPWVDKLRDPGAYFTVNVYASGTCMTITSLVP